MDFGSNNDNPLNSILDYADRGVDVYNKVKYGNEVDREYDADGREEDYFTLGAFSSDKYPSVGNVTGKVSPLGIGIIAGGVLIIGLLIFKKF